MSNWKKIRFVGYEPPTETGPRLAAKVTEDDPWPDTGDNGIEIHRPGWIRDPKLKKWVRDEQLTYPDVGPTFPGVTDINKVGRTPRRHKDVFTCEDCAGSGIIQHANEKGEQDERCQTCKGSGLMYGDADSLRNHMWEQHSEIDAGWLDQTYDDKKMLLGHQDAHSDRICSECETPMSDHASAEADDLCDGFKKSSAKTGMARIRPDRLPANLKNTIDTFRDNPNVHVLDDPYCAAGRCGDAAAAFREHARQRGHVAEAVEITSPEYRAGGGQHVVVKVDNKHYVDWTARQFHPKSEVPRVYNALTGDVNSTGFSEEQPVDEHALTDSSDYADVDFGQSPYALFPDEDEHGNGGIWDKDDVPWKANGPAIRRQFNWWHNRPSDQKAGAKVNEPCHMCDGTGNCTVKPWEETCIHKATGYPCDGKCGYCRGTGIEEHWKGHYRCDACNDHIGSAAGHQIAIHDDTIEDYSHACCSCGWGSSSVSSKKDKGVEWATRLGQDHIDSLSDYHPCRRCNGVGCAHCKGSGLIAPPVDGDRRCNECGHEWWDEYRGDDHEWCPECGKQDVEEFPSLTQKEGHKPGESDPDFLACTMCDGDPSTAYHKKSFGGGPLTCARCKGTGMLSNTPYNHTIRTLKDEGFPVSQHDGLGMGKMFSIDYNGLKRPVDGGMWENERSHEAGLQFAHADDGWYCRGYRGNPGGTAEDDDFTDGTKEGFPSLEEYDDFDPHHLVGFVHKMHDRYKDEFGGLPSEEAPEGHNGHLRTAAPEDTPCEWCEGEGELPSCQECQENCTPGTGYTKCSACKGKGSRSDGSRCGPCKGAGMSFIPGSCHCAYCDENGPYVSCPFCEGSGIEDKVSKVAQIPYTRIVGFAYDADTHCVSCTRDRFKNLDDEVAKGEMQPGYYECSACHGRGEQGPPDEKPRTCANCKGSGLNFSDGTPEDSEGNPIHPMFAGEDHDSPFHCTDCGESVCATCGYDGVDGPKRDECEDCEGTGKRFGEHCGNCEGDGYLDKVFECDNCKTKTQYDEDYGGFKNLSGKSYLMCENCKGTGNDPTMTDPKCYPCRGSGLVQDKKEGPWGITWAQTGFVFDRTDKAMVAAKKGPHKQSVPVDGMCDHFPKPCGTTKELWGRIENEHDELGYVRLSQVFPQPVGMHEGDNGIDDPKSDADKSKIRDVIPGTQRSAPGNNVWNVSIDNLPKTGGLPDGFNACTMCEGKGSLTACAVCKGYGQVSLLGTDVMADCPYCDGVGRDGSEDDVIPCQQCKGSGIIHTTDGKLGQLVHQNENMVPTDDSQDAEEPAEPQPTDTQLHVVRDHPRIIDKVEDPEIEGIHLEDHFDGWNTHNPETLRVAKK